MESCDAEKEPASRTTTRNRRALRKTTADTTKPPTRLTLYATIAALVLLVAVSHRIGLSFRLRQTFEGWGLAPFTVNVLFATILGLIFGVVLRGASALSRWFKQAESE